MDAAPGPELSDMPKNRWVPTVAAACLCAALNLASGADPRFTVIDKSQGLPRSSVLAMTQTRDGCLWLGTGRGLARYDGMQFTLFNGNETPGLSRQMVVKIFEDSRTNLWVGTESAGVFLARNGQWTNLDIGRGTPSGHLVAACEDSSGGVWLSTGDGQLYRYLNGKIESINARKCHALIAEDSGLIWIGLESASGVDTLFALGPFTGTVTSGFPLAYQLGVGKLDYLLASRQGGYWRLANNRIEKWRRDQRERDYGVYPWNPAHGVSAACEDNQGNLIVGTYGDGVYWFDAQGKVTHLSSELGTSFVFCLVMDHQGCLWVGTDANGLKSVRPQVFELLDKAHHLAINSVCEDGDGGLWFAINNGGVDSWNNGQLREFREAEGLRDLYVRSVFADSRHRLWAGTKNLGLFELQNGQFHPAPVSGLPNANVAALFEDRHGTLWVGTATGLARQTDGAWKVMTRSDGLSANSVQALAEDAEGSLWAGTTAGLDRLQDGRMASFGRANGLPSDNITALRADSDGVLWIGTDGGLARLQDGKFTSFGQKSGLPAEVVDYLVDDDQGYLWVAVTSGLFRAQKKEINAFAADQLKTITWREYGEKDGFPTTEYGSGSQPAAWRSPRGRLWFPTTRGLVSVEPAQLVRNTNQPPVVIESVRIQDQWQSVGTFRGGFTGAITVPPGKQRLEIHYTSLNLADADRARFRYVMDGFADDWRLAGAERVAYYDKLPPGHYRFRVQACNEDEVWNEKGCTLAVDVLPPFWETWWFLTSSAAALLGLIVGSVHYASTQRLQRQLAVLRQQEALELERARIARDLHDQLGANLTQVALLGEMAEADREVPDEVAFHARQICQTARETTRALDEIVWTVNPSNDTLDGLMNYICKYAQEYFEVAGLRYRLNAPAQLPDAVISPEFRHNVFLVAKEAVNNVVKHAQAASVWLRLRLEPGRFILELEDDGRGLDPKAREKGRNGLRNMAKRMADIGGQFEIGPAKGRGTLVRLSAPLAKGKG
jgi:ligand-binding sensor domain-containing protein/signal transduction histidine kinase